MACHGVEGVGGLHFGFAPMHGQVVGGHGGAFGVQVAGPRGPSTGQRDGVGADAAGGVQHLGALRKERRPPGRHVFVGRHL